MARLNEPAIPSETVDACEKLPYLTGYADADSETPFYATESRSSKVLAP
jgi:hypothetical protein